MLTNYCQHLEFKLLEMKNSDLRFSNFLIVVI